MTERKSPSHTRLAEHLPASFSRKDISDIGRTWIIEAERRFAAYLRGERTAVTARTAIARMKKSIR